MLGSDFYKALALFSQAECPFNQAGSVAPAAKISSSFTASPAIPPHGTVFLPRDSLRSAASTAESIQRTLPSGLGGSMHSSCRPSTSPSTTWKSEQGLQSYSMPACTGRSIPYSGEKASVSPFSSESIRPPIISTYFHQDETCGSMEHKAPKDHFCPSSSEPLTAVTDRAVSSRHGNSHPTSGPEAPRPSTAPSIHSERLSQMLPPKRELPFKVSRTTSGVKRRVLRSHQASGDAQANKSDNPPADSTDSAAGVKESTDHVTSTLAPKSAIKLPSKETAITKKFAAASRSRKKASVFDNDSMVPSVEELVRRSHEQIVKEVSTHTKQQNANTLCETTIAPAITRLGDDLNNETHMGDLAMDEGYGKQSEAGLTAYQYSNIDTQTLLARLDQHQRQRQLHAKGIDATETGKELTPLLPSKPAPLDVTHGLVALPHPDEAQTYIVGSSEAAIRRAGADVGRISDISTSFKVGNVNTSQKCNLQEDYSVPQSAQKPAEERSARSTDIGNLRAPEGQPVAVVSNVAQPGQPQAFANSTMMALMSDPAFAESPEMAQWTDLTREERDAALESWMCQQLESESFATLLKTLEGMWQRMFFGR